MYKFCCSEFMSLLCVNSCDGALPFVKIITLQCYRLFYNTHSISLSDSYILQIILIINKLY